MWTKGNYRRNLLDMHIDDSNPEYLSKVDPKEYVDALSDAGVQAVMLKARPHTGLAYFPTKVGRMHKGLKGRDFFGETLKLCKEKNIVVIAYFSQIFDNWAYDNHPDWRIVCADGLTYREYRNTPNFKTGRYGIVCPNNEDYRKHVRDCITEMNELYDFEGMFLDMTFWPDVCYCSACRKKYFEATGKDMPRKMDWKSEEFLEFVKLREDWMTDFAKMSTKAAKAVNPNVTIEHQFSRICCGWIDGSTEDLTGAVDYLGGDYYGGFLQQSFINKFYKNVSPSLPFVYHTSRCDPALEYHTTTKTREEMLIHAITALVHNGAFLQVDAVNPDGSIVPEVYHGLLKSVFDETRNYEQYVSGKLYHDAAIWFASHAKWDPREDGVMIKDKNPYPDMYIDAPVAATQILRSENIPFEVIGIQNIEKETAKVMLLPHVVHIRDNEMDLIEDYVKRGGNLLITGPIGCERLEKMLGLKETGRTVEEFTYMSPTEAGKEFFKEFSALSPMTVPTYQTTVEVTDDTDMTVLATLTLPYTVPGTEEFSAIHSNPPGIHTDKVCAVLKKVGDSQIIWLSSPIEMSRPYLTKQVYKRMVEYLAPAPHFKSNAPKFVEVLNWEKDGVDYLAVINEQEESPIAPMYEITVTLPFAVKKAILLSDQSELPITVSDKETVIHLPKLEIFHMIKIEK